MTDPITAAERLTEADDLRATLAIRDRQLRDALDLAASRRPQVPGETAPDPAMVDLVRAAADETFGPHPTA